MIVIRLFKYISICLVVLFVFLSFGKVSFAQFLNESLLSSISEKTSQEPPSKVLYEQYINSGIYYFKQGLHDEAKDSFWEAINLFPDSPDAYINLATVYMEEKNTEVATRILLQAKQLSTQDYYQREILLYNLGLCFYMLKNYQKARTYFQNALGVYPDFGEAMYYLGMSYHKLGYQEDAFINIFIARYIFEEEMKIEYKNKADQALKLLRKSYPIGDESLAKIFFEEGKKSLEKKEFNRALAFLQESIFLNPQGIDVYYELALLYSRKQAFYNAIVYLNKIIEVDPKAVKAYLGLGYAYQKLRKYEQALKFFEKALRLDKKNSKIYYDVGIVYLEDGKFNTAKRYLGKAKKIARGKKNDPLLKKINDAYLRIEKRQLPKYSPPHFTEKTERKKSDEPLYPHYTISGNKGHFEGGYFMVLPKEKVEEKKKGKSAISIREY